MHRWISATGAPAYLIVFFSLLYVLVPASSGADVLNVSGKNLDGQLGDGTTTYRNPSVQVAIDVEQIAAGWDHSLFVKTDGTLWSMGYNLYGQLGDGTTTNRSTPVQVATGVSQAAAGESHSLFVNTDGTLRAMGRN